MLAAAIDVGSNSTRLLVADVQEGQVVPIVTDMRTTRLGQGFMEGRLLEEAMSRTIAAIEDFVRCSYEHGVNKIYIAATSAVRDAQNSREFADAVYSSTGIELRVLSGTEEARLSYEGAIAGTDSGEGITVVDIGGGSTEFTWVSSGRPRSVSVNAGAVRMTEWGCGQEQVEAVLKEAIEAVKPDCHGDVVGVGGTVTTLAAMAQVLRVYDREKVHGYKLTLNMVKQIYHHLIGLPVEARKRLPGLQPERADIIPAGTLILSKILRGLEKEYVVVSEADILYGLVMQG
ncbi:exopolyphosphatase / guanosine-5'-triphosphate,3'-diphosphate pyrophosphatase [Desulfotomaculum arcticum]|uniref:Exopolyphosphatase / guanosine-5'-triphosphate,3'-diphosphate pyrophosphatase n=1 Tax=Desulfotruncus arcticus DSM 17038 TaxID=1121424 RepID=A0A1I2WFC8_9FIRM|nr:hypothetical protein [Desulfotruncus arcticus]SFH00030.1 exopolyphosphatase / guanosine-5'-triphosphate,3'-diphosphate pyrophosphatase [Desulfotomaculum arcticum] [Desulfotruncus arcticus DSM 17038]